MHRNEILAQIRAHDRRTVWELSGSKRASGPLEHTTNQVPPDRSCLRCHVRNALVAAIPRWRTHGV